MNDITEKYTEEQIKNIEDRFTNYIVNSIKEITEDYQNTKTEKYR